MLALLLALLAALPALAGEIRVDVLDVGQGDSILIRTADGKTVLIDAGELTSPTVPLLQKMGVQKIDLLVATHAHADHIGRMQEVVQTFPVKLFLDNGLPHTTQTYANLMAEVEARQIPYRGAVAGTVFNLDVDATLKVLHPTATPLKDTRSDLNSNSVVLRLDHGEDCMLFTGDSEEPTEHALVDRGLGECDILKVAHHGSNHSTTDTFLAALRPTAAIISCGAGNRYGHPGAYSLGRLRSAGVAIHRTDLEGTVTVVSTGKGFTIRGEHPPTTDVMVAGVKQGSGGSGAVAQVQAAAAVAEASLYQPPKKSASRKKKDTGWTPATPAETPSRTYTAAELTGVMDADDAPAVWLSPYERRQLKKAQRKAKAEREERTAQAGQPAEDVE